MGFVRVTVEAGGLMAATEHYVRNARQLPMASVTAVLIGAVDDTIQAQGAVAGRPKWSPFAPSTLEARPYRRGGMLLQDTGLLANMQPRHSTRFAEVRSPAPYAGFHVTGTAAMEKRDFLAVDMDATLAQIADVVLDDMVKG